MLAAASACKRGDATAGDSTKPATGDASAAASANADGAPQSQLALPVTADAAREGDLILRVNTTGQIRSDAAVKLRAEVAGTVAQVLVRPGARVTKGQVLVKLDPYPFDLAVREAQASTDQAEQSVSRTLPARLVGDRPQPHRGTAHRADEQDGPPRRSAQA
ncbi:MAG: biotin/lipoyl-binding protein [Gemmatimonadaceae bacterium]|nr:biotin/lipoyl-binding protein [Gemmatimonadaceae bacterium]